MTDYRQKTDGRAIAYSERECEFMFAHYRNPNANANPIGNPAYPTQKPDVQFHLVHVEKS